VLLGDQGHPTWARTCRKLDKAFLWKVRTVIFCHGDGTGSARGLVSCPVDRTLPDIGGLGIGETWLGWAILDGEPRGRVRRPRGGRLDGRKDIILKVLSMMFYSLNVKCPIRGGPRPNYRSEPTAGGVLLGANLLLHVVSRRWNSPPWFIDLVSRVMRHIYRRQGAAIGAVSMVRRLHWVACHRPGVCATRLARPPRLWSMTSRPVRGLWSIGGHRPVVFKPLPFHSLMPGLISSRLIALEATLAPLYRLLVFARGFLDPLRRMVCSKAFAARAVGRQRDRRWANGWLLCSSWHVVSHHAIHEALV
jgi:hypothetical protein